MEIIRRNTDYALRALVHLCKIGKKENKSVKDLAHECDIPEIFLRKIFQKLNNAGIVKSDYGPKGGYSLNKNPGIITVLEIVEIIQGKFAINKCFLGETACPRQKKCALKNKFKSVQQDMLKFLNDITIDMLASENK